MLIKRSDAQRVNRAVERVVGLADENRKHARAQLRHVIREHVGIPERVAGADLARGGEGMEQPRGDSGEEQQAGGFGAAIPTRGRRWWRNGRHTNLSLRAAKITMRSSSQPWRQRWILVSP